MWVQKFLSPPPLTLQQQNANDLLSPPPWTSGHVCLNTYTRPEVDSCTITLLFSGPLRSCPREEGQNSHIHMEQPLTHLQCARQRVWVCVWAQLEEAVRHLAYVWKRAHQRHGPKWRPTWVYLLIFSVLLCSFRCSYMQYMTATSVLIHLVPTQTLANNTKVLSRFDTP